MTEASLTGWISNIQRMSTEDGPGIRTTVFMKGCGLRCAWCHNPESLSVRPDLGIIKAKCAGCGSCIPSCPEGALFLKNGKISIDDTKCTGCFRCVRECYNHVLQKVGERMDVPSLMKKLLEDRVYFDVSKGGVTFSGGEPLLQQRFVSEMIRRLREEEIDTMVETALFLELGDDTIEALKLCSELYVDVKLWDPELAVKWTGQSNETTLRNIRKLDDAGVRMLIRTPVIEGVNDNEEELLSIARFQRTLRHSSGYRLIPYHPYGLAKYDEFRKEAGYRNREPFDGERFRVLEEKVREIQGRHDI